jgi:hypothetical protein
VIVAALCSRLLFVIVLMSEGEPVEATVNRFNKLYQRPVIPFYRTTLYELVQTTHLAVR